MKKLIIAFFAFALPYMAFAQTEGIIINTNYKSVRGIGSSVKFNDHLSAFEVDTKGGAFDVVAVNDNFQIAWQTSFDGYGVSIGRFKDKLLVLSTTEYGEFVGYGNTYKAFILDPATGNKLLEKVIYDDGKDYIEIPQVFIADNYFKLVIRKTNLKRKMHIELHQDEDYSTSQKLQILDFNDKLEPINTCDAVINGYFINAACNKNGDAFLAWLNGPDIEVYKYPAGKTAPARQLNADVAIKPKYNSSLKDLILLKTSPTRPDNLYYTLLYRNENNDPEMMLGKMDFEKGTKKAITNVFVNDDIKALEKGFTPVNPQIKSADLGNAKELGMKGLFVSDNTVGVSLQGGYMLVGSYNSSTKGFSVLYNIYDDDLNMKSQPILPGSFRYLNAGVPANSNRIEKDKLFVTSNIGKGIMGNSNIGFYAILNLVTGQWEKMELIGNKSHTGFMDSDYVIWFDKGFIAPYLMGGTGGFGYISYRLMLQGVQY